MPITINGDDGISGVDGSAATPALQGTDTNTGISFGTDEVNIVTDGSTRATVDSNGRLGVGTSSPSELLTLRSTGEPKIQIEDADLTNRIGQISQAGGAMVFRSQADTSDGQFVFNGFGGGTDTERMRIDSSGDVQIGTTAPFGGNVANRGHLTLNGTNDFKVQWGTGGTERGYLYADSTNLSIINTQNGYLRLNTNNTERLKIAANGVITAKGVYDFTTANSANVAVLSAGQLYRSTSSSKYKTQIEDLQDSYADALLDCRPVWYRSTCEGDNPEHGWWGFIAEEVAAIDPRLVHWKTVEVTYDENGSAVEAPCDPEPEGVAYDRFVPHLLNLIKRQKEAIEALETRVAQLEGGAS